jgi:ATP-dependent Clp protease adaptor protein ClpS
METPEIKEVTKSKVEKQHQIILHNDSVNTFEHVIICLMLICGHDIQQAEQCAMMIHHKGKCGVKSGGMDELLPIAEALDMQELHIEII